MTPSICRDAQDAAKPCRFVDRCAEKDQLFMHQLGHRGKDCWRWQRFTAQQGYEPTDGEVERAALQEGA